jgi:hypothetical protein
MQSLNRKGQAVPDKACFDSIYDLPDPRGYFRTLGSLKYQIPHHAQPVFRAMLEARSKAGDNGSPPTVVDLCCSYGVNTGLINHAVTLEALRRRYISKEMEQMSLGDMVEADRKFFSSRRRTDSAHTIGLDASRRAIDYAMQVGLMDEGFAENLEMDEPSPALRDALAPTSMITVTGGIGYISHRTIERIMESTSNPPWVVAFVLRVVPYKQVEDSLSRFGLVTEKLEGRTFPQRRFANAQERESVLRGLARLDVDVSGIESNGYLHTELYVSRPPQDVASQPLESLIPPEG